MRIRSTKLDTRGRRILSYLKRQKEIINQHLKLPQHQCSCYVLPSRQHETVVRIFRDEEKKKNKPRIWRVMKKKEKKNKWKELRKSLKLFKLQILFRKRMKKGSFYCCETYRRRNR